MALPQTMCAAMVVAVTIGLLATAAVPEYLAALVFFFLAMVLAVAPAPVVFSGFFSGAVWLVFGGLILGAAIDETGLGRRVAGRLVRLFSGSYGALVTGTIWGMALLAFFVPSSVGRVVIMLPVVLALGERMGFSPGSPGRAGLALAVGTGTLIPSFAILPASVANVAMAGAAEAIHRIRFTYTEYLILHFPVIGLVSMAVLPVLIVWLFPAQVAAHPPPQDGTRFDGAERRLVLLLTAALALWATDALHGVAAAWVALGAAILCVAPGFGVMRADTALQKLNFGPVILVAGVIGLGAVVTHSGFGRILGDALVTFMPIDAGSGFQRFATLVAQGFVMALVTTLPGQPGIMTALAESLSQATGWPLATVLMAQVPSWPLTIFPYQAPPLLVTMAISGIGVAPFLRLLLPFAIFGWTVMVPLQYLWWRWLGYLPG
jgi:di/tricarboxylate transporter